MNTITFNLHVLAVDWLAGNVVKTNRGKPKAVLTGEPRRSFWQQWARNGAELRRCGVTLKSHGKGKWEVVLWLNKHNLEEAAQEVERRAALKEANGELPAPIGDLRALFESCIPDENRVFDGAAFTGCVEIDSDRPF